MGKRIGRLGLVNYRDHPTNNRYTVFSFSTKQQADLFEEILTKEKIWFERDTDDLKDGIIHLFGVDKNLFEKAQKANYQVSARTRKHIIPIPFFRYALIIFFFAILAFAIVGYVKNS